MSLEKDVTKIMEGLKDVKGIFQPASKSEVEQRRLKYRNDTFSELMAKADKELTADLATRMKTALQTIQVCLDSNDRRGLTHALAEMWEVHLVGTGTIVTRTSHASILHIDDWVYRLGVVDNFCNLSVPESLEVDTIADALRRKEQRLARLTSRERLAEYKQESTSISNILTKLAPYVIVVGSASRSSTFNDIDLVANNKGLELAKTLLPNWDSCLTGHIKTFDTEVPIEIFEWWYGPRYAVLSKRTNELKEVELFGVKLRAWDTVTRLSEDLFKPATPEEAKRRKEEYKSKLPVVKVLAVGEFSEDPYDPHPIYHPGSKVNFTLIKELITGGEEVWIKYVGLDGKSKSDIISNIGDQYAFMVGNEIVYADEYR